MLKVSKLHDIDLTEEQLIKIISLINNEWPNNKKNVKERVTETIEIAKSGKNRGSIRFIIWDGEKCIGHASIFTRNIYTCSFDLHIRGLCDVCVSPKSRGEGLGKLVVKSVFNEIDKNGWQPLLFQTAIPEFYEKLGAKKILNKFYNSNNLQNPNSNPFWDENIMIYPSGFDFPDGDIDLNGNGF